MRKLREKLADLQKSLPMDLQAFTTSIQLPDDETCFEFSYFKTFSNILNLFAEKNAKILVCKEKEKTNYKQIITSDMKLSDPESEDNNFNLKIRMFSSGDGYHRFAEVSYDEEIFYIDRIDGNPLKTPVLF